MSATDKTTFGFLVTDYNVPVMIGVPAPSSVVPLTPTRARELLGSNYTATERLLQRLGADAHRVARQR